MTTERYTLIVSGIPELTPELADRLFEAFAGDIEVACRDGLLLVEHSPHGESFRDDVLQAIRTVEKTCPGGRVVRVESEAANTLAKINAELLSVAS